MPNIQFEIKELRDEFRLMRGLAEPFLKEESSQILDALCDNLRSFENYKGPMRLEATPDRPIKTRDSKGKYAKGGRGNYCIQAELYFLWELRPIARQSSRRGHRRVQIAGKASTVTKLYVNIDGSSSEIAHWRLEIGDSDSPGFYFHAQMPETLDQDGDTIYQDDDMWPKWLPVPRLPVLPFTPMLALEFVLGEIFQDEWPRHINDQSAKSDVGQWRNIYMSRFRKYLEWQQEAVGRSASPLMALKQAVPKSDIFIPV